MVYGTMSYFAGKDNGRREALKKILDGEGPLEREEILLDLCAKACTKGGWVTCFDKDEYNELGTEEVHEHWLKQNAKLEEMNLAEEEIDGEGIEGDGIGELRDEGGEYGLGKVELDRLTSNLAWGTSNYLSIR